VPMTLWDAWPLAAPSVRAPAAEQEVAPPDEAGGTYCPRSAGAAMTAPRRARTHTIRLRCFVRMIHIASTSCFRLFGRALQFRHARFDIFQFDGSGAVRQHQVGGA
jgi:hypothetical protein